MDEYTLQESREIITVVGLTGLAISAIGAGELSEASSHLQNAKNRVDVLIRSELGDK